MEWKHCPILTGEQHEDKTKRKLSKGWEQSMKNSRRYNFLESAFSYNAMHVDNSQKRIYHADKLEKTRG